MPEQLQNILWMAEELDFDIKPRSRDKVSDTIENFLQLSANPLLSHWLYQA